MTEPLYFVRIPIHLNRLWRLAAERNWTAQSGRFIDEGLALHHALGEVFGPSALQPFRLMVPPRGHEGFVYGYARQKPDSLRDTAALCGPEYETVFRLASIEAKSMPVNFTAGRRLGFDIRTRPVRRSRSLSDSKSPREIDVFQHATETRFPEPPQVAVSGDEREMARDGQTREVVYRQWLAERMDGIAQITDLRLSHFSRSLAVRNGHATEGPDAVLQGELTVSNPISFQGLLARGVGRHKAYGYGMILLRPVRAE